MTPPVIKNDVMAWQSWRRKDIFHYHLFQVEIRKELATGRGRLLLRQQ